MTYYKNGTYDCKMHGTHACETLASWLEMTKHVVVGKYHNLYYTRPRSCYVEWCISSMQQRPEQWQESKKILRKGTEWWKRLRSVCFLFLGATRWLRARDHCTSSALRATSHTRLKALDHGNVRVLIRWKGGDGPSSLHTRRWRPKGPLKSLWMKSLHGFLHGGLWIRVHGLPEFASSLPPRGGSDENSGRPWFF